MKRILMGVGAAVAIGAAIPSVASAHTAVVTCVDGSYVVTPSHQHLSPTWTIVNNRMVVTWSDGFTTSVSLPTGCEPLPEPPPAPKPPEVVPQEPLRPFVPETVPVTCAELLAKYPKAGPVRRAEWGCPVPVVEIPPKADKPKRKIVTTYVPCPRPGKRSKVVITVTFTSPAGKVVKKGTVIRWGKVCKIPAVTG